MKRLICRILNHYWIDDGEKIECSTCHAPWPYAPTHAEEHAEELAMEVLVARRRLGEAIWTFRAHHEPTLRRVEAKGWAFVMHGITEGTVRAGLTEKGASLFMSDTYTPPRQAS